MTTTLLQIQTHPATDRAASTDTMRDRARRALRSHRVFLGATAVVMLHIADDNFLQPNPGVSAGDHFVSGLVPLALLLSVAVAYPRVRAGTRAVLALAAGLTGILVGAVEAGYYTFSRGPSGDDFTGWAAAVAGLVLLGLGACTLWHSRCVEGSRARRYARRAARGVAAVLIVGELVGPFATGYITTHVSRAEVPAPDGGPGRTWRGVLRGRRRYGPTSRLRAYSEAMTVRVVFADDNFLVREGLAGLLTETDGIDLVATVADPDALLAAVATHRPDAVLTDIRMPPTFTTEGIDAAKRIRVEYPDTGVVVLSQYVEEDYAYGLLSDGVAGLGYLLKERVSQVDELVRALQDVARGGSALDPKVVEGLMDRKNQETSSALQGLTERELEVLQELATGRSNASVAKTLFMSERAVEKHVGSVFMKLSLVHESDVNRRVMAVLAFLEATGGPGAR